MCFLTHYRFIFFWLSISTAKVIKKNLLTCFSKIKTKLDAPTHTAIASHIIYTKYLNPFSTSTQSIYFWFVTFKNSILFFILKSYQILRRKLKYTSENGECDYWLNTVSNKVQRAQSPVKKVTKKTASWPDECPPHWRNTNSFVVSRRKSKIGHCVKPRQFGVKCASVKLQVRHFFHIKMAKPEPEKWKCSHKCFINACEFFYVFTQSCLVCICTNEFEVMMMRWWVSF